MKKITLAFTLMAVSLSVLAAIGVGTAYGQSDAAVVIPPNPQLIVDLRRDDTTYLRGEPILFAVRLLRELNASTPSITVGSEKVPWSGGSNVNVTVRSTGDAPPDRQTHSFALPSNSGQTRSATEERPDHLSRTQLHWGPRTTDAQQTQITLDNRKPGATLYLAILTDDLAPGEYAIEASLTTPTAQGDQPAAMVDYVSSETGFTLRDASSAADRVRVARGVARHLSTQGDYAGGIKALAAVLTDAASDPFVHLDLGLAYERTNQAASAIAQYERFIAWAEALDDTAVQQLNPPPARDPRDVAKEFRARVQRLSS